jgi:hypothetical protein
MLVAGTSDPFNFLTLRFFLTQYLSESKRIDAINRLLAVSFSIKGRIAVRSL